MLGGTLIITKKTSRHQDFVNEYTALGFPNVMITSLDKDALYFLIDDLKPNLILMDAMLYKAGTPYMMRVLLKHKRFNFKNLNIAVFAVDEYPADLGMMFIANGAKSFLDINDGNDNFREGQIKIRAGENYISPSAKKRIDLRDELPAPVRLLTKRHQEVLMLACCGFDRDEIADCLEVINRTVDSHKTEIYRSLNTDNSTGLLKVSLEIGLFTLDDLVFFGNKFEVKPKVTRRKTIKKSKKNKKAA